MRKIIYIKWIYKWDSGLQTVLIGSRTINYHFIYIFREENSMSKAVIPLEEYKNIVQLYNSGLSQQKIGKMYATSHTTIRKVLIKNNVVMRDNSHKGRKYTIDENYFDNIDSQDKAYILGLLYADGCNYLPQHRVKIELQERDKDILDKINIKLNSNKPLSFVELSGKNANWQNTYRLDITNKHISETLNNLGMVQNKSLVLTFPYWLDTLLYSHFLRGYFDGDGCLQKYFLTIVSTKEFCESVATICKNILDISTTISDIPNRPESNTKLLCITGISKMKKFLDYIYQDAELYVQRKYDAYQNVHYQTAI